jgi:uncharacterized protein YkwD
MDQINQRRAAGGMGALVPHGSLAAAAQKYADLLFSQNPYALNHYADGAPQDRAIREGYPGRVGEVLVTGAPSAQELMDSWMSSPPHAGILMGGDFDEMGVGCHEGPYTTPDGWTFQVALCVGLIGIR